MCVYLDEDKPESLVVNKQYVVKYGTTQRLSSLGWESRTITVIRHGLSSELEYHREGRPIYGGVWVLDHSDNDRKKFFYYCRFIEIQPEWYDLI